jgi:hypothetical protein
MPNTGRRQKIMVSADGKGIVSHGEALLLTETARVTGLQVELPAGLARWRRARAVNDLGKMAADLAVAVPLGCDCLADVGVLRAEPALFGPVASDPVVLGYSLGLRRMRRRAKGHSRSEGGGLVVADIDATILTHNRTSKRPCRRGRKPTDSIPGGVRHHGGDSTGEPLAIMLWTGNAGSDTAADPITATGLALPGAQGNLTPDSHRTERDSLPLLPLVPSKAVQLSEIASIVTG